MAEEHVKAVNLSIPEQFIGLWIEEGGYDKVPGKITVTEKSIVWEQCGTDTLIVKGEDIALSEDNKKLEFLSGIAVVQGKPVPAEMLEGKASVAFSIDNNYLLVEISGVKENVQRCGAVPRKGCEGIKRQIVDGEMVVCINYSPELHRYRKSK